MAPLKLLTLAALACAGAASTTALADETNFPARSRTLEATAPAGCRDWSAPLPERRVKVSLPKDAKRYDGAAYVTFVIDDSGRYGGIVEAVANDEAFVRAAKDSLQQWSFAPARCNGSAIATEAKVYFNFRQESFVSYTSGGYFQ